MADLGALALNPGGHWKLLYCVVVVVVLEALLQTFWRLLAIVVML